MSATARAASAGVVGRGCHGGIRSGGGDPPRSECRLIVKPTGTTWWQSWASHGAGRAQRWARNATVDARLVDTKAPAGGHESAQRNRPPEAPPEQALAPLPSSGPSGQGEHTRGRQPRQWGLSPRSRLRLGTLHTSSPSARARHCTTILGRGSTGPPHVAGCRAGPREPVDVGAIEIRAVAPGPSQPA
jgi:hypothetical protein